MMKNKWKQPNKLQTKRECLGERPDLLWSISVIYGDF